MHDEDNAIGLEVTSSQGTEWWCYGDKRALDKADDTNLKRCQDAVQASATEIYNAWTSKIKPSKDQYQAWSFAPTLESAGGPQVLQALFTVKGTDVWRRTKLTNRRDTSKTNSGWTYIGTYQDAESSGCWNYPITMDCCSGGKGQFSEPEEIGQGKPAI
jgi:hypothetical protein